MHPLGRLPLWGREGVTHIVIESEGGDKRMSGQDKELPRENREFRQSKKMRLKKSRNTGPFRPAVPAVAPRAQEGGWS